MLKLKMALDPAREITKSVVANTSGNSPCTYSNCLYPSLFCKLSSRLPFPQR